MGGSSYTDASGFIFKCFLSLAFVFRSGEFSCLGMDGLNVAFVFSKVDVLLTDRAFSKVTTVWLLGVWLKLFATATASY